MALTATIQPVQVLNKQATFLTTIITSYDLQATVCTVQWGLWDSNNLPVAVDVYNIPPDVLANWGSDDTLIPKTVASYLGVTITGYVDPNADPHDS